MEAPGVPCEVPSPQLQQPGKLDQPGGNPPGFHHDNMAPSQPSVSQPTRSRDERMRQMREKREQQRLKKQNQKKIGLTLSNNKDLAEVDVSQLPFDADLPQYSPSISHDEIEQDVSGESGASNVGSDLLSRRLIATPTSEGVAGREGNGFDNEELEKGSGEEEEDDWDEKWSDVEDLTNAKFAVSVEETPEELSNPKSFPEMEHTELGENATVSPSLNRSSTLVLKTNEKKKETNGARENSAKKNFRKLTAEEEFPAVVEVEEELDLFADMAPNFPTGSSSSVFSNSVSPQMKSPSSTSEPVVIGKSVEDANSSTASRSSLNYEPQQEVRIEKVLSWYF